MFSLFKKKPVEPVHVVVVPRIKHTNFLRAARAIPGMEQHATPLAEPLAGDLLVTYAVDTGPAFEMVSPATLDKYGLERASLRTRARTGAKPALRSIRRRTDGVIHELTADDNMAACTILFAELWDQIEREEGGKVVAIFPHRDRVYFGRADDAAARPALQKLLGEFNFEDNHALSQLFYTRAPSGAWQAQET